MRPLRPEAGSQGCGWARGLTPLALKRFRWGSGLSVTSGIRHRPYSEGELPHLLDSRSTVAIAVSTNP